jgi:ribosomal-protein-serine acetyltransferase
MDWAKDDYGLTDAQSWIEMQQASRAEGSAFEFLILDSAGTLLGTCGINRVDSGLRLANVGYWIRTSATGRGIAAAGVRELVDWTFAHTPLVRLEIVIQVANTRSQRVAEKLGAVREGVLRARLWSGGRARDALMYSIIRPGNGA